MRRLATITLLAVTATILTGCIATPTPEPIETPAPSEEAAPASTCLPVTDLQAEAISEGVQAGITLTDWHALQVETGPGAWFITALANGPGLEDEPFVFFTSADPENFTGGIVKAADNVTAAFVDWPMQEGAMTDPAFRDVQDCNA